MNTISNVAMPVSHDDAASKMYVDNGVSSCLTQTQADSLYYLNTTHLNNIAAADGDIDVNNQRILNVGNAATSTDALSWVVADTLYYRQSVKLNEIAAPTSSVSLDS